VFAKKRVPIKPTMNRTFSLNLLFLIAVNLLIKPFFIFGIDRTVQNQVGAETYGMYAVLTDLAFLSMIINDFGIQSFNNRLIAQSPKLLNKYFSIIFVLKLCLCGLYAFITFGLFFALNYEPKYFKLIFLLTLNSVLNSLILYFRSCIAGLGWYRTDSWFSVLDKFCLVLFASILLWMPFFAPHFEITYFVYAQTLSLMIAVIIGFQWIIKEIGILKFKFNPKILWVILRNSYPYALTVLLMTLATKTDKMLIERLLPDGKAQAGMYAAAYRLYDAANIIGFLFAGLLLPMFAKRLKARETVHDLLKLSSDWIWAGSIAGAMAILPFRQAIMVMLYPNCSASAGDILGLLMFAFVATALGSYIYGALLTAGGFLIELSRIFLIIFLLNIVLNFILIPTYQGVGAAMAAVITQSVALVAQIVLAKKVLKLPMDVIRFAKYILYAILLCIIAFGIPQILPNLDWRLQASAIFVISIFLSSIFGFLNISSAMSLKN
jgi:O-antigen/teichoic acid export membrane protein